VFRTTSWRAAIKRRLPLAALTLVMIAAVVSLLVSRRENNQLREQAVGTAALRDMVAKLRSRNQALTRMQLDMQPTQYERENQIYVNFPLISTDREWLLERLRCAPKMSVLAVG